jgi:O-antigen/teichoic acid export membrane protein
VLQRLQAHSVRLLRWSEKYTKTDMVYLAHGSFWLSSSSLITGAISFGLALVFANLFTKDAYGTYKYVLTLFGILCVACLRGIDTVVTQGAARGNDGTIALGLAAKIRWSLLGSLGALAIGGYYFHAGNHAVAWGMIVAAIFVPLMEPFGIFNAALVGKKDFKLSSILGIAGQIGAAIPLALTVLLTNNPVILFIVYAASWTISRYISLKITLRKYPPNGENEPYALSYALHFSVVNASAVLIASLDSVLIYHFLGAAELAVYTFAMAPVTHARTILDGPTNLAIPKMATQRTADVRQMLHQRTKKLVFLGAVLTCCYCILAVPFYHILFHRYIDAIPYSLAYSLTLFTQVATAQLQAVVGSRTTLIPKRLLYIFNTPSVVIAACAVLLIPTFGLWGAIVGQLLSNLSGGFVTWFIWRSIQNKEHASA